MARPASGGTTSTETELEVLARRLATASQVFPVRRTDAFDSIAIAAAEGNIVTITVTDQKSQAKREYRAELRLVGETVPSDPQGRA